MNQSLDEYFTKLTPHPAAVNHRASARGGADGEEDGHTKRGSEKEKNGVSEWGKDGGYEQGGSARGAESGEIG